MRGIFMRLIYVTVVISLVSMILIGSYLYAPAGLKAATAKPASENVGEIKNVSKKGETLFDFFMKYKKDVGNFLQAKKI
jgi:hypothetical protein